MRQRGPMVFVVVFCLAASGCAAMRNFDGSLDKDIKRLKQDNETCQRTLQEREGELDQLNKQLSGLNREMTTLKNEKRQIVRPMQKELAKTGSKEQTLKEDGIIFEEEKGERPGPEQEGASQEQTGGQTAAVVKGTESKSFKLKVLSGNGKISSAKSMMQRLKQMGYSVESTDLASRSNFPVNTVYYAPAYREEAKRLAAQLGRGAVSAPLTWPSTFHIIVVTGP